MAGEAVGESAHDGDVWQRGLMGLLDWNSVNGIDDWTPTARPSSVERQRQMPVQVPGVVDDARFLRQRYSTPRSGHGDARGDCDDAGVGVQGSARPRVKLLGFGIRPTGGRHVVGRPRFA